MNKLYYGDNLTIMQNMRLRFVDLVYLDPPFNSKKDYNLLYKRLTGKPVPEQAEALFHKDPFQFQHWFVERVGGFPSQRKVADKGIDGRLYLQMQNGFKEVVLSVKGGKLRPTDVRDLRGVLEREPNAILAGLLSLQHPSKAMQEEAARAGMYEHIGVSYERIQLLTVQEVLEGKRGLNTPTKVRSKVSTRQCQLL